MQDPLLRIPIKEIQRVGRIYYEHKINLKHINGPIIHNFYIQQFSNMTDNQTRK